MILPVKREKEKRKETKERKKERKKVTKTRIFVFVLWKWRNIYLIFVEQKVDIYYSFIEKEIWYEFNKKKVTAPHL